MFRRALVLLLVLVSRRALAQTSAPVQASAIHVALFDPSNLNAAIVTTTGAMTSSNVIFPTTLRFNNANCVCRSPLVAKVSIDNPGTPVLSGQFTVQVWLGQNCSSDMARLAPYQTCQLVTQDDLFHYVGTMVAPHMFTVTTDALLGTYTTPDGALVPGCVPASPADPGTANLWIVIVATGAPMTGLVTQNLAITPEFTRFPQPPTLCGTTTSDGGKVVPVDASATAGVCAVGGDHGVELSWGPSPDEATLQGYQVLCQTTAGCNVPGANVSGSTTAPNGGANFETPADIPGCGTGTGTPVPDSGLGRVDSGPSPEFSKGPPPPEPLPDFSISDGSIVRTDAGQALVCNATFPSARYACGGLLPKSSHSARVNGLTNGVSYKFWIAAVDQNGNLSVPVPLGTATAVQTQDFWNQYKNDGGQATGGFCSAAPGGRGRGDRLGALLLLLVALSGAHLYIRWRRARAAAVRGSR